ncbi:hypothetical protein K1719_023940 [Acacia pycnantha]|nr:hypothetical protein K1719_023940 [Acacia pycnantha]
MYRVANASQYLAITGKDIEDIKITKKSWVSPCQSCTILNVSPVNYTFNVQAISAEKLPFILPVVFTIGPKAEELECLLKYARLLSAHDQHSNHVNDLVQGVIEGETRVLTASMTMEEIFKNTKEFKKQVFDHVQLELNQFGLLIYHAYVKQLVDVAGHEYFLGEIGSKTREVETLQNETKIEANQARVDVAEAKMKGEIGSKTREVEMPQNEAKIDAEMKVIATRLKGEGQKEEIKVKSEVKIFENEREEANSELATKKAYAQEVEAAKAVALREAELQKEVETMNALREAELQKEVETMNALTRTEKLKGEFLTKAGVDYETKVQKASGLFYQKQKEAEAFLFEREKKAEAQKTTAAAALFARMKEADGELYSKLKEVEGTVALGQAQGTYLRTLLDSLNGNYTALREYLIINGGLIQDMARLQP